MDGNGRWAETRDLRRTRGHAEGVESVRATTRECARIGIEQLTLFAFSEENWKRPQREVSLLMRLLRRFLVGERSEIMDNNIRLTAVGRIDRLPEDVRRALDRTREMSAANSGMNLCLALSYGGQQEIVDAVRSIAERVRDGRLEPGAITAATIDDHLYQPRMPAVDLMIRTAGEMRLSNFLLWKLSYAELYVTPACWPAFREAELGHALDAYAKRVRKFGGLVPESRG
jgi:undecaprenyl diphosphate synthase